MMRELDRAGSEASLIQAVVADFLGRPFSFDAWRRWLETGA